MILHCVFCNFRVDAPEADRDAVLVELRAFSLTLEGVSQFAHGPNRDFEKLSQDYDAGFVIHFRDAAALQAYAQHPTHQALGKRLVSLCEGGTAGLIVFDLETA